MSALIVLYHAYIWYIHYQLFFLRFQHTMIMSTKPRTDPPRKKPRFPPISPKRQVQSQIRNSLSYENRKESNERCTTQSESPSVPNQACRASELNENLGLQNERNCMMAKKSHKYFLILEYGNSAGKWTSSLPMIFRQRIGEPLVVIPSLVTSFCSSGKPLSHLSNVLTRRHLIYERGEKVPWRLASSPEHREQWAISDLLYYQQLGIAVLL